MWRWPQKGSGCRLQKGSGCRPPKGSGCWPPRGRGAGPIKGWGASPPGVVEVAEDGEQQRLYKRLGWWPWRVQGPGCGGGPGGVGEVGEEGSGGWPGWLWRWVRRGRGGGWGRVRVMAVVSGSGRGGVEVVAPERSGWWPWRAPAGGRGGDLGQVQRWLRRGQGGDRGVPALVAMEEAKLGPQLAKNGPDTGHDGGCRDMAMVAVATGAAAAVATAAGRIRQAPARSRPCPEAVAGSLGRFALR